MAFCGLLEPLILLEEPVEEQTGDQHQQQGCGVAELPLELGHNLKVHTVHRANDSGHHEECRVGGDSFGVVVLLLAEQGVVHAQGVFEGAAKVFEAFFCLGYVVEHVAELAGQLHGLVFNLALARARVGGRVERAGA